MAEQEIAPSAPTRPWWGSFEIPEGKLGRWTLGPLAFSAERRSGEWRLGWASRDRDPEEDDTGEPDGALCPIEIEAAPPSGKQLRIPSPRLGDTLQVLPALADRPVVARPEVPLRILAGDELRLFVGTPLWLRVLTDHDPGELLLDVPIDRPSDTWFGASTRHGELAYATRTSAYLNLENVRIPKHRAITEILLRNLDGAPLSLERLNLPVPNLALHCDPAGRLWTDRVRIDRRGGGGPVEVHLDRHPPAAASGWQRVSPARQPVGDNVVLRALSSLLR